MGERTRTGKTNWNNRTIGQILSNTAYKGMAAFGKTRCGPIRSRLRPIRCKNGQSKQIYSVYDVPEEDWISIPIPSGPSVYVPLVFRQHFRSPLKRIDYITVIMENLMSFLLTQTSLNIL
jgi:Recombinase